ncbi:phytanoyl-CoA dioxygenase family protein [Hymenobacter cellulosilyticus]|uniref:Phytanoyl-CoA dioxygenase family protein n=1 Tax=Hymenobacter cellulosilyticus TaxID=2932248 RepID=A0A8T9Q114_9BACT|nr:phytanoyl-CoA dioxygenase family protein [Hymenobacter cellulosilyticus]UOQ71087.1 phytanoyl-CoA dioxygenase family protein [Hymenobacter cellulosilyticus]
MPSTFPRLTQELQQQGFVVLPTLLQPAETARLLHALEQAPSSGPNFRRSQDLFAIRDVLGEVPALQPILAASALPQLLQALFPKGCHLVKSIYFDKPAHSNWLVAWHQDLMISVDRKAELPGYGPWTSKPEGVAVQPPRAVLENICTIRLHLDACDATNGALKVVPGSHREGPLAGAELPGRTTGAVVCAVPAGGAMLMKPLLLHASNRSRSARSRRVLHLEFASIDLPQGLQWREKRELL